MFSNTMQVLWLLLVSIHLATLQEPKVHNGLLINISDYPFIVIVFIRSIPECTGTIITTRFVLTAAHCTFETDVTDVFIHVNVLY